MMLVLTAQIGRRCNYKQSVCTERTGLMNVFGFYDVQLAINATFSLFPKTKHYTVYALLRS